MKWFKALFSADEVVSNTMDKDNGLLTQFGGWVGGMQFTEQEQAQHNKELATVGIERLKALAPFKVMQRIMVTIIMVEWAIILNCMVICIMLQWGERFDDLILLAQSKFAWTPVFAAVSCYLLGGVMPRKGQS